MPYAYPTSVRKTSVYLTDELKTELAALARRWNRSEADLIREGVDRLVRSAQQEAGAPTSARPALTGPLLVGVGVGPSDPGLVTQRAATTLQSADRVFAPTTAPDAIGRAEAIARSVAPEARIERLVVDIVGSTEARSRSLEAAADKIVEALDPGAVVAFVTLGDPNMYSAFPAIAHAVAARRPSVPITTVPGVMAFQELAAESAAVLAEDGEHMHVLVASDDRAALAASLDDPTCTVVLYKGGRHIPEVVRCVRDHGRLDGAVVGEMLGLPGGGWKPLDAADDQPASYLATVLVPAIRGDAT